MPKRIRLRELTLEEQASIKRLATARTESISLVQRARIIQAMDTDPKLTASKAGLAAGFKSTTIGPIWVKRFNEAGVDGLADKPKSGRPCIHSEEVRSQLIALALQKPRTLGYPFELWTLERLQTAFRERHETHLSDSTIWTWMEREGLQWKRQQSWFHKVDHRDPEFVEKRGPS